MKLADCAPLIRPTGLPLTFVRRAIGWLLRVRYSPNFRPILLREWTGPDARALKVRSEGIRSRSVALSERLLRRNSMPNTVRLHRVLATKPDKVYRAFIEADAKAKWLPPNGFACTVHHLDAKVGGTYRMSFRNFTTGKSHFFGGKYLELVPGERLRYSDRFEDPNLPGEIQVTVALKQGSVGPA